MTQRLISTLYWAAIAITAPFLLAGSAVLWLLTVWWDRRRVLLHLYACAWATLFVRINPLWRVHISGRDRLPWRGGAVLVANHASLIDILVLFGLFRPYKWVSKAENFKLPFIGWNMTLNDYVPLRRGERASVVEMREHCSRHLRRGAPVMFFPEGTRTRDGLLLPFKDGAFELAIEHGVPVIPIAVHGTGRALPKHGMVLREHVHGRVDVLEALHPADFPDVAALRDAARDRLAAALGQTPQVPPPSVVGVHIDPNAHAQEPTRP